MEHTTMIMMSVEDLRNIIREEVGEATKDLKTMNQLPAVLNREQIMDLLQISHSKATELFGRADFPTIREFGHVKVRTEKLFEWMDYHTQLLAEETSYFRSIS